MVKENYTMDNRPKISVIIPIYNTAEYLPRCLDSILDNSYKNVEVICINDGSTDDSAIILEQYAKKDVRIIVINKENGGISSARNAGLDKATGDFIAFIDSDDWIHPQYFEILLLSQQKTRAEIAACKYITCSDFQKKYSEIHPKTVESSLISNIDALKIGHLKRLVWGRLYRRSFISGLRFNPQIKWGEDSLFSITSLCKNSKIVLLNVELYYYYQRDNSVTSSISSNDMFPLINTLLNSCENLCQNENMTQQYIYLNESIKQVLALRYYTSVTQSKASQKDCYYIIKRCKSLLQSNKILSKKKRIIFSIFINCPTIYRIFRIVTDISLLKWERKEKKKCNIKA